MSLRDIDKVDELMQDITEQQELAQEISDAISKPVGFGEEFDEVIRRQILHAFYCSLKSVCASCFSDVGLLGYLLFSVLIL